MECYCYLRNVEDLQSDGKHLTNVDLENNLRAPVIASGAVVEYHQISAKGQSRVHQFGKKVLLGIFLGYALFAG